MTDPIEALAEGLAAVRRESHVPYAVIEGGRRLDITPTALAQMLSVTPSVAALLAEAEVGQAVLALPSNIAIQHTAGGRWRLYFYDREPEVPMDGWHTAQAGPTLPAAIAAALEDGDV